MKVIKVADKTFIGKGILYILLFSEKMTIEQTYNMLYSDGKTGKGFMPNGLMLQASPVKRIYTNCKDDKRK